MRRHALLMLGLSFVLGVVAVYLAHGWLQRRTADAPPTVTAAPMTTVVVAKHRLAFGDVLTAEFLHEAQWPAGAVPKNAFSKVDDLVRERRVVLRQIEVNEPVLAEKVSGAGGRATLASLVPEDLRAVTIRVNDVNGVGGFVLPGNRVDVLMTTKGAGANDDPPLTTNLIQNVLVLGVDQDSNQDKTKPAVAKAVTIEVTPFQAQQLALASQVGHLTLSLRNEANTALAPQMTATMKDLLSPVKAGPYKAARAGRTSPTEIRVVRGTKSSMESVLLERPLDDTRVTLKPSKGTAPAEETESSPVKTPEAAASGAGKPTSKAADPAVEPTEDVPAEAGTAGKT